jgi:hypothetical protein
LAAKKVFSGSGLSGQSNGIGKIKNQESLIFNLKSLNLMTLGAILKAENISKQYRLGTVGTGTLSHDLNRWWHKIRGKEDPYLKIGDTNDRSTKGNSDYVWALQDINFEIAPSDFG